MPKPSAGTTEEWRAWKKAAKAKRWRYWLAEEGLDLVQNFVYCPVNCFRNVRHYIDNRYVSKTHALTSQLKQGQWHEFNTRLLHATFDELMNFVEIELAWFHMACSEEEAKKYQTFEYRKIALFSLQNKCLAQWA